jgi:hypothetical protein
MKYPALLLSIFLIATGCGTSPSVCDCIVLQDGIHSGKIDGDDPEIADDLKACEKMDDAYNKASQAEKKRIEKEAAECK